MNEESNDIVTTITIRTDRPLSLPLIMMLNTVCERLGKRFEAEGNVADVCVKTPVNPSTAALVKWLFATDPRVGVEVEPR